MKPERSMSIIFLPVKSGLIKIHIKGFQRLGSWGKVTAELNGITVYASGFQRKKTIIKCLKSLHETILKKK